MDFHPLTPSLLLCPANNPVRLTSLLINIAVLRHFRHTTTQKKHSPQTPVIGSSTALAICLYGHQSQLLDPPLLRRLGRGTPVPMPHPVGASILAPSALRPRVVSVIIQYRKECFIKEKCELLKAGMLRESNSVWNSPVFLIKQKGNRSARFLVDFRSVNAKAEPLYCSLPSLEEVFDQIGDKSPKIYSVMDLKAGYYSCLLYTSPSPRDRQKSRMPSSA